MGERYQEALQWLDEGLSASDELGGADMRCVIRGNQGVASLLLGELADAARALDDALELCHEAGGEEVVDEALLATAALAAEDCRSPAGRAAGGRGRAAQGRPARARASRRCVDRLHASLERARSRADPDEWERAEREGAQLDVSEAIAAARSGLTAARQASSAAGPAGA